MNAKTMEGLAGASTSIRMVSTPMNVAKEAERKGDTDKMQRALGYAAQLTNQAEEYSEKTSQGMKLEAEESKEQEKLRQENLDKARKEKRAEQEKQVKESIAKQEGIPSDSVEISEEGKHIANIEGEISSNPIDNTQDVTYSKSGEAVDVVQTGEAVNISI